MEEDYAAEAEQIARKFLPGLDIFFHTISPASSMGKMINDDFPNTRAGL
jgi:hypothetical protein